MKALKFAGMFLLPVNMLFATTYYASPDGAGTGTSPSNPCSITDGFSKIKNAAHTLVLARGRYRLPSALSLPAVKSTTEQTVVMGETGNPADVILDAQLYNEVMRLDFSCLITGVTMMNGSSSPIPNSSYFMRPASGVRISYGDNTYGPSIVSNCVITCCTNTFNKYHTYPNDGGEYSGKQAYGGAVYVGHNGVLVDSVVSNNMSCLYSGGVLVSSNSTVRGCTIAGNTAVNGGAGMFCDYNAGNALVEDCIFSNNTITATRGSGGGLDCRADGASLTLTNCTFVGNTATLGAGLDAVGDVVVSCVKCNFVDNSAGGHGAGVRLATTAVVRLDGCTFDGNRQTAERYSPKDGTDPSADYAGGGGVFVQTQSDGGFVSISNCVFRNNSAQSRGGGFGHTWLSSVYGEIVNCVFTNNSSYRQGGGMVLRENTARADRPFVIRNSLFAFNRTTGAGSVDSSGGGVHFVSYGNPILDSCTIVSNNCGRSDLSGGLHHRWGGTVKNCIIAFNTKAGKTETGTAWCLVDPNNTSALVPSAYVNSCAWPAAEGAFLAANGCVNADPKFRDAAHGDFSLKASSPCRDAGVYEDWMATARDVMGMPRIFGPAVDMGCYEHIPRGMLIGFW